MYKEVYDLVKAPLVFINSWDFQWPENIKSMQKLVKESDESGVCRLCVYLKLKVINVEFISCSPHRILSLSNVHSQVWFIVDCRGLHLVCRGVIS